MQNDADTRSYARHTLCRDCKRPLISGFRAGSRETLLTQSRAVEVACPSSRQAGVVRCCLGSVAVSVVQLQPYIPTVTSTREGAAEVDIYFTTTGYNLVRVVITKTLLGAPSLILQLKPPWQSHVYSYTIIHAASITRVARIEWQDVGTTSSAPKLPAAAIGAAVAAAKPLDNVTAFPTTSTCSRVPAILVRSRGLRPAIVCSESGRVG